MVLSLPDSSPPDPLSKFEALSRTSLSPPPRLSLSSSSGVSESSVPCSVDSLCFISLFLDKEEEVEVEEAVRGGGRGGGGFRLSAFLWAFSAVWGREGGTK